MTYDAQVIVQFAEKLYSKASSIIVTYTFVGVIIGAFGGFSLLPSLTGLAVGAIVIGLLALKVGIDKSFQLKLQAQMALCQVQIESNTA